MLSIKRCFIKEGNSKLIQNFSYPNLINIYEKTNIDKDVITQINKEIYQDIISFKHLVESDEEIVNYSSTEYKVTLNKELILSICVQFSELAGSQDITYINTYNYDINQNKKLELIDIFNQNTNYLEKISEEVQNKINKIIERMQNIYTELSFEECREFIQIYEDQTFYIRGDRIVICFSSYELGRRFPKKLEVDILFDDYKDYLSDYTLENILGKNCTW